MKKLLHPLDGLDLPNLGSPELDRIDDVCEEFESAIEEGDVPPIESWLDRVESRCRPWLLFELLCLEFAFRGRRESFDADEYRRRFPEDGAIVERAIQHHGTAVTREVPERPPWLRPSATGEPPAKSPPNGNVPVDLPDQYEYVEEIGRGGQGLVVKARRKRLGSHVAIKMVLVPSSSAFDRLEREARTVASIRHPNIVYVSDIGTHNEMPYLVMEYVEGCNLAEYVQGKPLDDRRIAAFIGMAARAIDAAHQAGVLHRDVKPSNILVDRNQRILVTDFGLAKSLSGDLSPTRTGDLLGTVNYMPPEQAGKASDVGPAADVYSLGAVLYELLTGRPPIVGEDFFDTLRRLATEEIVPPSELVEDVHPDLEAICMRCLRRDPAERYESAAKLADDLSKVRRGISLQPQRNMAPTVRREPVVSPVTGSGATEVPAEGRTQWDRVPPWAWAASGVVATLLIGAVLFPFIVGLINGRGDGGGGGNEGVAGETVVPEPGRWRRLRYDLGGRVTEFEVRSLRDVDGNKGVEREVVVTTAVGGGASGETALLRLDLGRLKQDRFRILEGYVWLGPPEKALTSTVFGADYQDDADTFEAWRRETGGGGRGIHDAIRGLIEMTNDPKTVEELDEGPGNWTTMTLSRVVENLTLPEALPAVDEWKRYPFEFDVATGRAEAEIEVRGVQEIGNDRWILVQTKTVTPEGRVIWESGLLKADVRGYEFEKRLPIREGFVWIGDRNAIDGGRSVGGAAFAPNFDELENWHVGERFAVRDALHLLYDAEVWPRRSHSVRPQPVVGSNAEEAQRFRTLLAMDNPAGQLTPPRARLPYDLGALPAVGKHSVHRGSLSHAGLPLRSEIQFEVELQGIADGQDAREGQRLIAVEVRSGKSRRDYPEAALLWVDVKAYHERQRLVVVDGFEWVGDLDSLRGGQRENLVEFHPRFDQLENLHRDPGPLRLALRDALLLVFGADVTPSTETLSQVRHAFTRVRRDLGLDVSQDDEVYRRPGLEPINCRAAGVDAQPLTDEDAAVQPRLTTHFLSHPDVPAWASAKAELRLGDAVQFKADLELVGLPDVDDDGDQLHAALDRMERPAIAGRPFDLAWLPAEDGVGVGYSGKLVAYHPVTLQAAGGSYDLVLRTVGRERFEGQEFRRIEIDITVRHNQGSKIEEVASLLVDFDEENETIEFGPSLIDYGNGHFEEFDPTSEPSRRVGFGVREVLYLLFNAKQVRTSNVWVEDLRWYLSGRRRAERPVPGPVRDGHSTSYFGLDKPAEVDTSIGRRGLFTYEFYRSEGIPFGFYEAAAEVRDEQLDRPLFEASLVFEGLDKRGAVIDPLVAVKDAEERERRLKALRDNFNRLIRLRGQEALKRAVAVAKEILEDYPDSDVADHVRERLRESRIPIPAQYAKPPSSPRSSPTSSSSGVERRRAGGVAVSNHRGSNVGATIPSRRRPVPGPTTASRSTAKRTIAPSTVSPTTQRPDPPRALERRHEGTPNLQQAAIACLVAGSVGYLLQWAGAL